MNAAIIIFAALLSLSGFATWRMAHAATSDGDYTFMLPGIASVALLIALIVLLVIRFW